MNMRESIKQSLPIVHLFPLATFKARFTEKMFHFRRQHSLLAAKEISTDNQGNVLLRFRRDCEAAKKGEHLKVPRDKMIFEYLKNLGSWAREESDFLVKELNKYQDYADSKSVVVDMGANVGLISLQIARKAKFVPHFIFVEPLPRHIDALKFNVSGNSQIKSFKICEFALAKNSATGSMNVDFENLGASCISSNPQIHSKDFTSETIQIMGIDVFAKDYLSEHERIFLKSDLEGFDLEVLGNLDSDYWNKVVAGVIEIIPDESGDMRTIENILKELNSFSTVTWDPSVSTKVPALEISNFWLYGESTSTRNLFFSRK